MDFQFDDDFARQFHEELVETINAGWVSADGRKHAFASGHEFTHHQLLRNPLRVELRFLDEQSGRPVRVAVDVLRDAEAILTDPNLRHPDVSPPRDLAHCVSIMVMEALETRDPDDFELAI